MNITTTIPETVFSAQLPDLTVTTKMKRIAVTVGFGQGLTHIYSETLYADPTGLVTLYGLAELVQPFARQQLVADLLIQLTEQDTSTDADGNVTVTDGETQRLSARVVYSAAIVSEAATEFTTTHFLSRLLGPKVTALGRLEYLHSTGGSDVPCVVTAAYADGTTGRFELKAIGGNDYYQTFDVSPAQFETAGKQLTGYTVTHDRRSQQYDIDFSRPDAAPVLLFRNSFGFQELAYFTGTHKVKPDFKYSSGYVNGELQNYDIVETRTFEADSGPLTTAMADWLSDLFRSQEVYLVNFMTDGSPQVGQRISITDQKSELSNDDDNLPRFSVSYVYASRNHNYIDITREGRVFDNTFDYTFN